MLTRRSFGLATLGASLAAFATGAGQSLRRRFLFVHAEGGWDPLCTFAPLFDAPLVQMEPDAAPLTVGDFALVDGPGRPAVKEFFERFGERTLLVNGLSTRSVNHENCQYVALTGSVGDGGTDWATLLAAAEQDRYDLPHLVLAGPAFPGADTLSVGYADGLLELAVDGSLFEYADVPLGAPGSAARARVDDYLAARAGGRSGPIGTSWKAAVERSRRLRADADHVHFEVEAGFPGLYKNAVRLLADGVARCATISTDFAWDTHTDNAQQAPLYQQLFTDLGTILDSLEATPGADGKPLADDTVVVVLSEMGRTPAFNDDAGRDHWPYTSALVIGPGIQGGRTIGGYTDRFWGIGADPGSGELDPARPGVDAKMLGATLLTLGDVDPAAALPGVDIIAGALS
jgi:uncharacterized protein (DUF1501 family)